MYKFVWQLKTKCLTGGTNREQLTPDTSTILEEVDSWIFNPTHQHHLVILVSRQQSCTEHAGLNLAVLNYFPPRYRTPKASVSTRGIQGAAILLYIVLQLSDILLQFSDRLVL